MSARRQRMSERPRIEGPLHTATDAVSPAMQEWARELLERNTAAIERLDVAAGRHRGDCPVCARQGVLLYSEEPTDPDSQLVCSRCSSAQAAGVKRVTPCDNCGAPSAWRNPKTRRNEYLCGKCHAESGDGVVQNKWAPRVSTPLRPEARPTCDAKGVVGTRDCKGEVRWVKLPDGGGAHLCNAHRGKTSAGDGLADRSW